MRISLSHTGTAFQFALLYRFGALLLISLALARLGTKEGKEAFLWETWVLEVTTISYFWITGTLDALIPVFRSAEARFRQQLLNSVFRAGNVLSFIGAVTIALLCPTGPYPESMRIAYGLMCFFHFNGFFTFYRMLLQESRMIAPVSVAWFSAYAAAIIVPVAMQQSVAYSFWACSAVSAALYIYSLTDIKGGYLEFNHPVFRQWLRNAIPLAAVALVAGAGIWITNFIVRASYSQVEYLEFAYGGRELPVILLVANAFSSVQTGELATAFGKHKEAEALAEIKKKGARMMHLFFPLSLGLLLSSRPLALAVFGEQYPGVYLILDVFLLLVIPRMLFPQIVLRAKHDTIPMVWAAAGELAVNVALAFLLAWFWDVRGMALAFLLGFFAERIALIVVVIKKYGILPQQYTSPWWLIYASVMVGIFVAKWIFPW